MDIKTIAEDKIYFSPKKVIGRLSNLFEKNGIKDGITKYEFQQDREKWIAGVFLFGYSKLTNKQYWLQPNPDPKATPDIFAVSLRDPIEGEKGAVMEIQEIEICEYEEHSKKTLVEHIKTKLEKATYGNQTIILCYAHPKPGTGFKPIDIINGLQEAKTDVREIWILLHTNKEPIDNFIIMRVYSCNGEKDCGLSYEGNYSDVKKEEQLDCIYPERGVSKKVEFNHKGVYYHEIPSIKQKIK